MCRTVARYVMVVHNKLIICYSPTGPTPAPTPAVALMTSIVSVSTLFLLLLVCPSCVGVAILLEWYMDAWDFVNAKLACE